MDTGNVARVFGLFGLIAFFGIMLGLIYSKHSADDAALNGPITYQSFVSPDQSFNCDAPRGWSVSAAASNEYQIGGAVFRRQQAKITIESDFAGSLMGDVAQANNNTMDSLASTANAQTPPPVPPVEQLHQRSLKQISGNFTNYREQPDVTFSTPMGEARYSEFTAGGTMFDVKLHGYRVTILGNERRFMVTCSCPEKDWTHLKPMFGHVIASIAATKS